MVCLQKLVHRAAFSAPIDGQKKTSRWPVQAVHSQTDIERAALCIFLFLDIRCPTIRGDSAGTFAQIFQKVTK